MSKFPQHYFQQSCIKRSKMNNEATCIVSLDLECHRQSQLLVCSTAISVGSSCEHWTAAGFTAVCQNTAMVSRSDQTMGGNQPFPNYYIAGMMVLFYSNRSIYLKGLFTRSYCDCDIFIVANGLHGVQCKYSGGVAVTMTLNPIQSFSCS